MRPILPFSFHRLATVAVLALAMPASSAWAQASSWGQSSGTAPAPAQTPVISGATASPPGIGSFIREPLTVVYTPQGGSQVRLEAMITRPADQGRHPMVVLSHGAPRDAEERAGMSPNGSSSAAIGFARRGWIVIAPMRRGYGQSSGPYVEGTAPCNNPDYRRSALVSGQDVLAAAEALRANPHADPDRLLLVGVSAGGLASVGAGSTNPKGLVGVISFAGGRGSTGPDTVCTPQHLVDAMGAFGRTMRVPNLWIYSENDHFFGPDLARRMFAAFTASGAAGTFIKAEPYKEDGHFLFSEPDRWNETVDKFLRANGLPTWKGPITAPTANLPPPPGSAKLAGDFEKYLTAPYYNKAFAISNDGAWGWSTGARSRDLAMEKALENCNKHGSCHLYAVNDGLAK